MRSLLLVGFGVGLLAWWTAMTGGALALFFAHPAAQSRAHTHVEEPPPVLQLISDAPPCPLVEGLDAAVPCPA